MNDTFLAESFKGEACGRKKEGQKPLLPKYFLI